MIDLKTVLKKYPRNASTRTQLASILRDLYPTDKRAVNIALAVYDSGIASRISDLKRIDELQHKQFIKQLVEEYGLQECYAAEGIEVWAKAYGLAVHKHSYTPLPNPKPTPAYNPNDFAKSGQTVNGQISEYELKKVEGGYEISKFLGFDEENMIIPNVVDGKKIVGIGKDVFKNCEKIQSLTISDGIVYIENGAFAYCKNLNKVLLPNTLERIDSVNDEYGGAFHDCALEEIILPQTLRIIGNRTFKDCVKLKSIVFPNNLEIIGEGAFWNCDKLKSIVFPNNLKIIGKEAFWGCSSLNNIQFPASLREIGNKAFSWCTSISTIILNEGLISIGLGVFDRCNNLKKILIPHTVTKMYYLWDYETRNSCTVYCYPGTYGLEVARKGGYKVQNAENFKL